MKLNEFKGRFGFNLKTGQKVRLTGDGVNYLEDSYSDSTQSLALQLISGATFEVVEIRHAREECVEGLGNCTCGLYIDIVDTCTSIGIKDLMYNEITPE